MPKLILLYLILQILIKLIKMFMSLNNYVELLLLNSTNAIF